MSAIDHWLLPEGIEEMLPDQAWRAEALRRRLLDVYRSWGYELVIPPLIEFLESLLTGTGNGLDLRTFKLTDQLSGRTMGVRADMTPQAARIDAHSLKREGPVRLCYLGTVLHTRAEGHGASRSPLQVGAELFGHAGRESDLEVIGLMLETLAVAGVPEVHLDLGHVGIFRGLAAEAGLAPEVERDLFDVLQRKALPELEVLLAGLELAEASRRRLAALAGLHGDPGVLARAGELLAGAGEAVRRALAELRDIGAEAASRWPQVPLNYDLAELRGYAYHTGVVFAAFAPGSGQEIARGGRYDKIGEVFGRARPATGFSTDLKTLLALGDAFREPPAGAIAAPAAGDETLEREIRALREAGERVVRMLPGQDVDAAALGCDRELIRQGGGWQVKALGG